MAEEVDKFALTMQCTTMDAAYQKFLKEHAGYPKIQKVNMITINLIRQISQTEI